MLPKKTIKKLLAEWKSEGDGLWVARTKVLMVRKAMTAVASLNILSPSASKARRLGAPRDLNKDKTAMGSVAEIREPKSKATENGNLRRRVIRKAVENIESKTPKVARKVIVLN